MKLRPHNAWRAALASLVSASLVAGCFESFQFGEDEPTATGGRDATGAGGTTPGEGGAPLGGSGPSGGQSGTPPPPPLVLTDDTFSLPQGQTLALPAGALFDNDTGDGLEIIDDDGTDARRPAAYDATYVVGADGSLSFEPHADYWGSYRIEYTARDDHGRQGTASVTIQVRPVDVKLEAVAAGLNGFVLDGVTGDRLGAALAGAGDFDDDGLADLVVGAPGPDNSPGRAFVVYGKETTSPVELDDDTERFVSFSGADLTGGNVLRVGYAVSSAGDLNEDGFADIVVGAPGSSSATGDGRAFVLFGGARSGVVDLAGLASEDGYIISGGEFDGVGRVVGGGHDINGDGVPDVLVSSNDNLSNDTKGSLHVVFGPGAGGDLPNVSDLDIKGNTGNERLPHAAAVVGDVDGDGLSEVLLSTNTEFGLLKGVGDPSPSWPPIVANVSADGINGWNILRTPTTSCSHFGQAGAACAFVAAAGDVNGDGQRDVVYCDGDQACLVVLGVPTSLSSGWQLTGFPADSQPRVAGDGDVNDDGRSDLLFAVDDKAYVVFGRTSPSGALNVTGLDGDGGFAVTPEAGGALSTVALVGDVNGDGVDDFAIGDAEYDGGAGRVYVIFGSP